MYFADFRAQGMCERSVHYIHVPAPVRIMIEVVEKTGY